MLHPAIRFIISFFIAAIGCAFLVEVTDSQFIGIAGGALAGYVWLWLTSGGFAEVSSEKARFVINGEEAKLHEECPTCRGPLSDFYAGPSGGWAQNVLCRNCLHEFNVLPQENAFVMIDNMGKPDPARLYQAYGINTAPTQGTGKC